MHKPKPGQNAPISVHDMKTRQSRAIQMLTLGGIADPRAIGRAMKSMLKKYQRHRGGGSAYKPHQGAQEMARRCRQREHGTHGVDTWRINERIVQVKRGGVSG